MVDGQAVLLSLLSFGGGVSHAFVFAVGVVCASICSFFCSIFSQMRESELIFAEAFPLPLYKTVYIQTIVLAIRFHKTIRFQSSQITWWNSTFCDSFGPTKNDDCYCNVPVSWRHMGNTQYGQCNFARNSRRLCE